MRVFKTKLRFGLGDNNYENLLDVILDDNINEVVGKCEVLEENGEIVGRFFLEVDVQDSMYIYYRYDNINSYYYAIQLRHNMYPDNNTSTIANNRRY